MLIEVEVIEVIGVGCYECFDGCIVYCNGYWFKIVLIMVGDIEV